MCSRQKERHLSNLSSLNRRRFPRDVKWHQSNFSFYSFLTQKYTIKLLGRPEQFLVWHLKYGSKGRINLSQPQLIRVTLASENKAKCNRKQSPYLSTTELHASTAEDTLFSDTTEQYQQLIGYIRYLGDRTRPYIAYITSKLGAAAKYPTKRHLEAIKSTLHYLQGTIKLVLRYTPGQSHPPTVRLLKCHIDS